MFADLTNGLFELCAVPFIIMSIAKTQKNKSSEGVNWLHPTYFTLWGIWNLYYYPSLNQWVSFLGGLAIVIANIVWVTLLIKYNKKGKQLCRTTKQTS